MYDKLLLIIICFILFSIIYLIYITRQTTELNTESFTIGDNITKYNTLMTNLYSLDDNIIGETTNVNTFTQANPIYDPNVSKTNYTKVSNYIDFLKSNTADAQFLIDQAVKDKRISEMNIDLDDIIKLDSVYNTISTAPPIKASIKNPYSGVSLNLEPVADENLVYLNGKCLSYQGTAKYVLANCDASDATQKFKTSQIDTIDKYNSVIPPNLAKLQLKANIPADVDNFSQISGFYVVQPPPIGTATTTTECLTVSNSNISIEPCGQSLYQRWNASSNIVSC
jgi:hypothetical protein